MQALEQKTGIKIKRMADDTPICKTVACKKRLTWLPKTACWRCLICNPIPLVRKKAPEQRIRGGAVDVAITKADVAQAVADALAAAGVVIPKPELLHGLKPEDMMEPIQKRT